MLSKQGASRSLPVPHPRDHRIKGRVVKNNLATAGLTEEDLLRFLQKKNK